MTVSTSFFAELKRRNVIRVAIAYVAVSWLVMQAGSLLFQTLELSNAVSKGLLALLAIGFIPVLVFSWIYELTPEGLKRESEIERDASVTHLTGRKLDYLVIGVLVAVVALLLVDRFVLLPRQAAHTAASAPTSELAPAQASIAVLPFVNMSSDKEQEFFSDGISEELLNLLAKIPQLQVTARTSSFSFKGKDIPIPEIAKTLKVAHILEGSVRKSGDQVRVTAQLINAVNDKHLWSHTYDRKLDDVFAIQDEIAADVVKALRVTLLGEVPKATATNPEAYALYLQGNELARAATAEALAASDAAYQRAVEIDQKYMPAWDGLTRNAVNRALIQDSPEEIEHRFNDARQVAEKALALDSNYARSHARLGSLEMYCCGDLRRAVQHYQRALALDPRDPIVLSNAASLLMQLGRIDQAIAVRESVLRVDPVNVTGLANMCLLQRAAGRYDESIATVRTVLSLTPDRKNARFLLGMSLLLKGETQAALAEFEQEKDEASALQGRAMAYHALGRKAESDAMLATFIAKYEAAYSSQIAQIHDFRGEADMAFEWLDKAIERKDGGVREIHITYFKNIQSDPRWLPLLRKVERAPEQLAQIEFDVKIPPSIDDAATREGESTGP